MESFSLQFFSAGKMGGTLNITYPEGQPDILIGLMYVLETEVDGNKFIMKNPQRYTLELRERLIEFINKFKNITPSIQNLKSTFDKLEDNDWFYVLPPTQLNTKQKLEMEMMLDELNGRSIGVSLEDINKYFGCVIENYEILTFDQNRRRKIKIGKNNKNERCCRFCNKKQPEVTFNNVAHAVSEALGNKVLILNEECDECNSFFDQFVERDFIYLHDMARTVFGVKNKKNKIPKLVGQNFTLSMDEKNQIGIAIKEAEIEQVNKKLPERCTLNTGNTIKLQNIYKALCKYALSVIDSSQLSHFKETIRWLKGDLELEKLPLVATLNNYNLFAEKSELTLFLRNSNNFDVPFLVGQFRFAFYLYIFIVPMSSNDKKYFTTKDEYEKFLNCFKNIASTDGFSYVDFSQNIEKKLVFNIKFEQIKQDGLDSLEE